MQLCNDDGTWVRLSAESVREWCRDQRSEAWCLQYNHHLNKTLLFPVADSDAEANGSLNHRSQSLASEVGYV